MKKTFLPPAPAESLLSDIYLFNKLVKVLECPPDAQRIAPCCYLLPFSSNEVRLFVLSTCLYSEQITNKGCYTHCYRTPEANPYYSFSNTRSA